MLVVEPFGPSFLSVIARIEEDPNFQVVVCSTSLEATSLVSTIESCLVLCHAATQAQIVKHITMMKLLRHDILNGHVRVIVNTNIRQVNLLSLLSFYGCAEILPDPITPRAVHFKLQRHALAIQNARATDGAPSRPCDPSKEAGAQIAESNLARSHHGQKQGQKQGKIRLTDPLLIESDFWSVSKGTARSLGQKWVIKLPGPPLRFGTWRERPGAGGTVWDWEATPEDSGLFIRDPGTWVFRGQRPEFKDRLWWFVAERPKLSFEKQGQRVCDKFETAEDGSLLIARDSEFTEEAGKRLAQLTPAPEENVEGGRTDPAVERKSSKRLPSFQVEDPLTLEQDVWLLRESKPRWINSNWMVQLLGPPGDSGKWIEVRKGNETTWRWVPEKGPENADTASGAWEFTGRVPRLERGEWIFVGERPRLEFMQEETPLGAKLKCLENGDLILRADSEAAARAHGQKSKHPEPVAREDGPGFRDLRGNWKEEVREIRDLRGSAPAQELEARRATAPTLPALALACMVADLMTRRGTGVQFVRNRVCRFLSATFGGIHVELWHQSAGSWRCVGSFDEAESKLGALIGGGEGLRSELVVPEGPQPALWTIPLGQGAALAIYGRNLNEIPLEYARSSARILRGVASGLSEDPSKAA